MEIVQQAKQTLLMVASKQRGRHDVVLQFLQFGADVDRVDEKASANFEGWGATTLTIIVTRVGQH